MKYNDGNFSLSFYSVWNLSANKPLLTNILKAFISQVMQLTDMGLCMLGDILMNFMRAKFQMATLSNTRAVMVRTFHDFDS